MSPRVSAWRAAAEGGAHRRPRPRIRRRGQSRACSICGILTSDDFIGGGGGRGRRCKESGSTQVTGSAAWPGALLDRRRTVLVLWILALIGITVLAQVIGDPLPEQVPAALNHSRPPISETAVFPAKAGGGGRRRLPHRDPDRRPRRPSTVSSRPCGRWPTLASVTRRSSCCRSDLLHGNIAPRRSPVRQHHVEPPARSFTPMNAVIHTGGSGSTPRSLRGAG